MNNYKIAIPILFFFLAFGVGGWFWLHEDTSHPLTPTWVSDPDTITRHVLVKQFNTQGKLVSRLQAAELIHYREKEASDFKRPRVWIYDQGKPWFIEAESGHARRGTEEITLENKVVIYQPASGTHPATTVRTRLIHYFPNQQIAKTDQLISFTQGDLSGEAVGMIANRRTAEVELLSQVKGSYAGAVPKTFGKLG
jgi:LPS export ABC transporter protein LptC